LKKEEDSRLKAVNDPAAIERREAKKKELK
jgi:hypothetical protein